MTRKEDRKKGLPLSSHLLILTLGPAFLQLCNFHYFLRILNIHVFLRVSSLCYDFLFSPNYIFLLVLPSPHMFIETYFIIEALNSWWEARCTWRDLFNCGLWCVITWTVSVRSFSESWLEHPGMTALVPGMGGLVLAASFLKIWGQKIIGCLIFGIYIFT